MKFVSRSASENNLWGEATLGNKAPASCATIFNKLSETRQPGERLHDILRISYMKGARGYMSFKFFSSRKFRGFFHKIWRRRRCTDAKRESGMSNNSRKVLFSIFTRRCGGLRGHENEETRSMRVRFPDLSSGKIALGCRGSSVLDIWETRDYAEDFRFLVRWYDFLARIYSGCREKFSRWFRPLKKNIFQSYYTTKTSYFVALVKELSRSFITLFTREFFPSYENFNFFLFVNF